MSGTSRTDFFPLRSALSRYGSAIILTALATLLRHSLDTVLGSKAPFAAFIVAAALTAWYGGLGPALLTTFAGLFIALYFWLPNYSLASIDKDTLITIIPYLVICLSVSLLIDFMRRAQRRAEDNAAALNESRKLLSTTLGSIGDAVIATNIEGRVTFMNQIAESLTGWTRREAIGKPLDEIFV